MGIMGTKVSIREYERGDVPFIFNSWLKSYRGSPVVRSVPNTIYYAEHHEVISGILASANLELWVACDEGNPNTILGYVVGESREDCTLIHWVYAKQPVRMQGLAKTLLGKVLDGESKTLYYTHHTKISDE